MHSVISPHWIHPLEGSGGRRQRRQLRNTLRSWPRQDGREQRLTEDYEVLTSETHTDAGTAHKASAHLDGQRETRLLGGSKEAASSETLRLINGAVFIAGENNSRGSYWIGHLILKVHIKDQNKKS